MDSEDAFAELLRQSRQFAVRVVISEAAGRPDLAETRSNRRN
jgi:hypothetical protein